MFAAAINQEILNTRRILGIDPGTNVLGFAIIEERNKQPFILEIGVLTMAHFDDHPQKLNHIFTEIQGIIAKFKPNEMSIELPFYAKNPQSLFKLGRAQGVAIAAGMYGNLEVSEYSAKKIKQAVTGNGNASKEQVSAMLETIFHTKIVADYLDATDALATALCHYYQKSPLGGGKKYSGWSAFAKDNSTKIK